MITVGDDDLAPFGQVFSQIHGHDADQHTGGGSHHQFSRIFGIHIAGQQRVTLGNPFGGQVGGIVTGPKLYVGSSEEFQHPVNHWLENLRSSGIIHEDPVRLETGEMGANKIQVEHGFFLKDNQMQNWGTRGLVDWGIGPNIELNPNFRDMMPQKIILIILFLFPMIVNAQNKRIRDYGIEPGVMNPGKWNAITDVPGVKVGHVTLYEKELICTGVTAILPHSGNLFQEKVPAAVYVGNGFGKLIGFTQIRELGYLETPVILTNTLSVPTAAQAVMEYILSLPGNERVRSVNPFVGETNDGYLNDIRGFHVTVKDVNEALAVAETGPVEEGCVGAGTGTVAFGFKGGIGTSSRIIVRQPAEESYTVGVLVQSNFGGILDIDGIPAGELLREPSDPPTSDGSCMIIVATDAPIDARNLERLAKRAIMGLARTGGAGSNGSGDYVLAFSTAGSLRETAGGGGLTGGEVVKNDSMSPFFQAVIEATEEAILNSLTAATEVTGYQGHTVQLLPMERILRLHREKQH